MFYKMYIEDSPVFWIDIETYHEINDIWGQSTDGFWGQILYNEGLQMLGKNDM